MFLRPAARRLRADHPLALELAVLVLALAGAHLWRRGATALLPILSRAVRVDGLVTRGLLAGALLLAGLVLYVGVYALLRDIDVGLSVPSGRDRRSLGLALAVPPLLVGLTKLVGDLTGVPYNGLTMSAYGVGTPVPAVLASLVPGLLVGACSLTVVCQVLVQGTFARVVDGRRAAFLTTVLTAVVLSRSTGGLSAFPARGKLALAAAFVLSLGLALYAVEAVERDGVRYLAYLPVTAVLGLVVVSLIAATESVAELLFGATHVAVLGLAATSYERTHSLLVPAVAYLSLLLAEETVVLLFEAGMRSW
ncbi:hypothetical protein [Haloplanus pelagicus]|uniref:hypothetical protein n=1 Tax=Haloplanus pelagicus TaxID=2949995 RepID=UPI00203E79AC|nr:hypothetical protein [Haloplanus sp. HW8-1]